MPLTLYFSSPSGPARSVLLLARYLKLDIDVQHINLGKGEQHNPDFLKVNPLHKVPVIVDGDFVLPESRAILAYIASTRQPGGDLYPSDPKLRARVDRMLYYDAGNCYDRLSAVVSHVIFKKNKSVTEEQKNGIRNVMKTLNDIFLEGKEYFAGDKLTIADLAILASISTFVEMGYNFDELPRLKKWYQNLQTLPGIEENNAGAKALTDGLKASVEGPLY